MLLELNGRTLFCLNFSVHQVSYFQSRHALILQINTDNCLFIGYTGNQPNCRKATTPAPSYIPPVVKTPECPKG